MKLFVYGSLFLFTCSCVQIVSEDDEGGDGDNVTSSGDGDSSASGGSSSSPAGGSSSGGKSAASGGADSSSGGAKDGSGGDEDGSGGDESGSGGDESGSGGDESGSGGGGTGGQDAGTGGQSASDCTEITCGTGSNSVDGNECFTFTTGEFGGWNASESAGCAFVFDGEPSTSAGESGVGAGEHDLEVSGCTNEFASWTCWN